MRTGAAVDAAAVVAIVLPLAGLLAPVGVVFGATTRPPVATWGRRGALVAAAVWVVLVAAHGAPELGRFEPDGPALAAAAGACLLAAGLAREPRPGRPSTVASGLAPAAAAAMALVVGVIANPDDLSRGEALALAAGGGIVAALAAAAAHVPGEARLATVAMPAALLIALRGAGELVGADPAVWVPLGLAAMAVLLGIAAATPVADRLGSLAPGLPAAAVALTAVALAAGPLAAARPAAALLAAAAVLAVAAGHPLAFAAGLPGVAVAGSALADVPVAGASPEPAAHVALGVLVALAVAAVAVACVQWTAARRPPEVVLSAAALILWLLLAPGTWWWAVGDGDPVAGWDRAAPAAAAGAAVVLVAIAAARLRADPGAADSPG